MFREFLSAFPALAIRYMVKFVGVGEKLEDLEPFDPDGYVEALFV